MRIGKPLLLITTPIGLAIGLYEGWRLAGGLVFVMALFIAFLGVRVSDDRSDDSPRAKAGRGEEAGRQESAEA